jgi:iron complex outermembrane recepter protein
MISFKITGSNVRYFLRGSAATIALVASSSDTGAQTQSDQSQGAIALLSTDDSGGLETVVVTARKRSENAQDVPVAVTAIDGAELDSKGISQIQQLEFQAPGLVVNTPNARQTNFAIRGLGNNPAADGLFTSVGLYIDGVYLDRPGMADFDLFDLDHVEVLRGPQGTLFGKNTTAGAVSFTTQSPDFNYTAKGEMSIGDFGLQQYQALVTGPITDTLAFRLTGYDTNRDGYLQDVYSGQDLLSLHRQDARAQLLWKPTDALSLRLIGEYGHENDSTGSAVLYSKGPATSPNPRFVSYDAWAANLGLTPIFNPAALQSSQNGFQKQVDRQYSLTSLIDWNTGDFTVSSVTGWRHWSFVPNNDFDWTSADVIRNMGVSDYVQQFSQELRVASTAGGAFDYVAGAYYFWRDLLGDSITTYGSQYSTGLGAIGVPALNNGTTHTYGTVSNNSYALFAQSTWHFDPRWDLTTGVRETYEFGNGTILRTPFTGGTGAPPATVAPYSGAISNINWSPSALATLDYKPSANILTYGTVSYGEKAGGFNPTVPQTTTGAILPISMLKVQPEKALDYELGVKSELLDRRLIVNLDAYWMEVYDYQANAIVSNSTGALQSVITNVGAVRSRGFEGELTALPFDDLRLNATISYDDAIYQSFVNAPSMQGAATATQDLSGRPVVQVPKWSVNLGATYVQPLSPDINGYIGGDLGFKSSYFGYIDDSPFSRVGGYGVGNIRVGATFRNFDLSAWVRNVGDAHYYYMILPAATGSGGYVGIPAEPRMVGVTFKASF